MDRRWAAKLDGAADPTAKLSVAYDYLRSALSSAEKDALRNRELEVIERLDHVRLDAADQLVAVAAQIDDITAT
ncbi:hypothetical protein [Actinoplanes sp. NBRC 103695]|uniref:hypothetical protein n=1 Tax=Actinoplanes sp. NBRC 103695 TaxID=3032202 RepID=UPI0024A4E556|nr:hypothetical protein [Actinoplanes sp. NBRC 103695]GLZ00670.1 hypothetical protein Acsp02_79220 [Actinoplanes sp. NBRC 103695]